MKPCPTCGAKHAPDSDVCDCGYQFPAGAGSETVARAPVRDGSFGSIGVGLIIIGCLAAGWAAFVFDTSVGSMYDQVENIGLLQRQLIFFQAGAATAIVGGIFIATDKILAALEGAKRQFES